VSGDKEARPPSRHRSLTHPPPLPTDHNAALAHGNLATEDWETGTRPVAYRTRGQLTADELAERDRAYEEARDKWRLPRAATRDA
jgi:hypothetical protein